VNAGISGKETIYHRVTAEAQSTEKQILEKGRKKGTN
jgi:hypothetical protein